MRPHHMLAATIICALACGDGTTSPPATEAPVPTSITLSAPTSPLAALGSTTTLAASVLDQNGAVIMDEPLVWSSSAPSVAPILSSGLLIALSPGTTDVTASSGSLSETVTVTVSDAEGSRIVYVRENAAGFADLFTIDDDGSDVAQVTTAGNLQGGAPAWAPDGTAIAVAQAAPAALLTLAPDGSELVPVISVDYVATPAWSPDAQFITYDGLRGTENGIFRAGRDGSGAVNLTGSGPVSSAIWSPDGTQIAFAQEDTILDQTDVWVMASDGTSPSNLTASIDVDVVPAEWSADGETILCEVDAFICVLDLSGPAPALDTIISDGRRPSWSADGSRIVFDSDRDGARNLYVADADGSNLVQITFETTGRAHYPHWFKPGT